MFLIGLSAAAITGGILYAIAPGSYTEDMSRPIKNKYFAHRGLYSRDQSIPENSLPAFKLACEEGYGIELDIQLSQDGEIVVFHDDNLSRACGVDRPVCELTLAELKELSLFGGQETIPTFSEVLELINGRVPLIVELKPAAGKARKTLCGNALSLLRSYQGPFCIESFDTFIVSWFKKNAPDILRGQLAMPAGDYDKKIPWPLRFHMSRCLGNYVARPHFIAYDVSSSPLALRAARAMGALYVGWTSKHAGDAPGCDAVIFEHYLPENDFK